MKKSGLGGKKLQPGKLGKVTRPGQRHEQALHKSLGVRNRLQPGSGSYAGRKGDLELLEPETFLIECKETEGQVMSLQFSWLRKITSEARALRKTPALALCFARSGGPAPADWVCLPLDTFNNLISRGR